MLRTCETPVGVVDLPRVRANVERVVTYCSHHDITWRPHVKTHKSVRIARLQLEAGAPGLTVATPREAEVMATMTDDLLVAYPVVGGNKLQRLMALPGYPLADVPAIKAKLRAAGTEVIDLGIGDPGLPVPGVAIDALQRAAADPALQGYGFQGGLPGFRLSIAAWLERRFGRPSPGQVMR